MLTDGKTLPVEMLAYDYDTGFGLLRTIAKVNIRPMELGSSSALETGDKMMIASHGGPETLAPAIFTGAREFAGYWEYLLDDAPVVALVLVWEHIAVAFVGDDDFSEAGFGVVTKSKRDFSHRCAAGGTPPCQKWLCQTMLREATAPQRQEHRRGQDAPRGHRAYPGVW